MKIGVFGSAFDPPHLGHADVINQALTVFDKVVIVPSYQHPFGKVMAPFKLRVDMAKAMCLTLDHPKRVVISKVEEVIYKEMIQKRAIYTFDVLLELSKRFTSDSLTFVAGPDNLAPEVWGRFYRVDDIIKNWGIWGAQERLECRSSSIRPLVALGKTDDLPVCDGVKVLLQKNCGIYG